MSISIESISKLLSLLVALGYLIAGGIASGSLGGLPVMCFYLAFPLALIWFPEYFGAMTGYVGQGGRIDTETPPWLVSLAGWFFLVGFPLLTYAMQSN